MAWFSYLETTLTLTNCMHQNVSWVANIPSVSQEIPRHLWNLRVHPSFHKAPPLVSDLSQMHPVHKFHPLSRSSILISSHLPLGFSSDLFLQVFQPKYCIYFSTFSTFPSHHILLDFITLIILGKACNLWSSSLCCLLQHPTTFSLLGPNIFLSTLFPNTLKL